MPGLLRRLLLIAAISWGIEILAALAGERDSLLKPGAATIAVELIRDTTFSAVVLPPFEPVRLMAEAPAWPAFLFASGSGLLIWIALMAAGLAIDADFRTTTLVQQERLQRRRRFQQRAGTRPRWDEDKTTYQTWPMPRSRSGFGPLFWARLSQGFRGRLRCYLQLAGILVVAIFAIQWFFFDITGFLRNELPSGWIYVLIGLYLIPIAAGNLLPYYGNRDLLKPLPVRPNTITTAEILASACHLWVPVTAILFLFGAWIQEPVYAAFLSALFYPALIVAGAINLAYQTTLEEAIEPASLNGFVHIMVSIVLALFGLLCTFVTAGAVAWTITLVQTFSPWVAFAIGWLTVAAIAAALLPVAARSFALPNTSS